MINNKWCFKNKNVLLLLRYIYKCRFWAKNLKRVSLRVFKPLISKPNKKFI